MQAVVERYGKNCLIQFEDFGNANAFKLLDKYRKSYCTFNDDIQGTAAVAVAGILASLKITGKSLADNKFVFQGAGEASIGIAMLLVKALEKAGLENRQALDRIWMVDSKGLIVKDRPKGGVTGHKVEFAREQKAIETLTDVVMTVKPTCIIGAAAVPGAFTEEILRAMGDNNDRPIIFALSNPTSKAECTAEQAYSFTNGRAVFSSGSPFRPLTVGGKTFYPGQGNNAYIFPGVGLAVVACKIRDISEDIFLHAAERLAQLVTKEHLEEGRVYPPLTNIREVSTDIAVSVSEFAFRTGIALLRPEPTDKRENIVAHQYSLEYSDYVPPTWDWPLSTKTS